MKNAVFRTTLRRLEVFVCAVEAGGFRACSDVLGISQAAVSNQIKQLEAELGYRLFVRKIGAVGGVTEQGATAYREAKELLEHASLLSHMNGDRSAAVPRRLAVHADSILDAQLAKEVAHFIADCPSVGVALERSYFEEIVHGLSSNKVDVAYFYSAGPVNEVRSELAWKEPMSICARHDHPIFAKSAVTPDDLNQYPFVAPPRGTHFRRSVDRLLRQNGLDNYKVVLETGNANVAREAVISGFAISAVITQYLNDDLIRYGVREVRFARGPMELEVRRALRRELMLDKAALALTHYLDQTVRVADKRGPDSRMVADSSQLG